MNKNKATVIAIIITILLSVLFVTMLLINNRNKEDIPDNAFVIIKGDSRIIVTMEDLIAIGEEDFTNWHRNSTGVEELETYSGVEFIKVLEHYNIDITSAKDFLMTASDGYSRIYTIEEIEQDKNVYITTKCDGEPLLTGIIGGNANDGGPFMIIKRTDYYSENRVKKFYKVTIN